MNPNSLVDRLVTYHGENRPHLKGRKMRVVRENAMAAEFIDPNGDLVWCSKNALKVADNSTEREKIVAEIEKLEERLNLLKTALTVIDSLS